MSLTATVRSVSRRPARTSQMIRAIRAALCEGSRDLSNSITGPRPKQGLFFHRPLVFSSRTVGTTRAAREFVADRSVPRVSHASEALPSLQRCGPCPRIDVLLLSSHPDARAGSDAPLDDRGDRGGAG